MLVFGHLKLRTLQNSLSKTTQKTMHGCAIYSSLWCAEGYFPQHTFRDVLYTYSVSIIFARL